MKPSHILQTNQLPTEGCHPVTLVNATRSMQELPNQILHTKVKDNDMIKGLLF
jgi:hypothetical protein